MVNHAKRRQNNIIPMKQAATIKRLRASSASFTASYLVVLVVLKQLSAAHDGLKLP
jgi:hypothetical protein